MSKTISTQKTAKTPTTGGPKRFSDVRKFVGPTKKLQIVARETKDGKFAVYALVGTPDVKEKLKGAIASFASKPDAIIRFEKLAMDAVAAGWTPKAAASRAKSAFDAIPTAE
jgi:hypothetical protein